MPKRKEIVLLAKDFLGNLVIFTIIPLSDIVRNQNLSSFAFQLILAGSKSKIDKIFGFLSPIRSFILKSRNQKVNPMTEISI